MLKADQQGERRFRRARRKRDMQSYRAVSSGKVHRAPRRDTWTDVRWSDFKKDVRTIARFKGQRFWALVLTDG